MSEGRTLPQISKQKSTKDMIISVLSREWPLSAKRIYNKLVSEEGKAVSYQAVHKIIKEMEGSGLLIKKEKEYLLNSEWIGGVKKFASSLETAYSSGSKADFRRLREGQAVNLGFNGILNVARFLIGDWMLCPNPDSKPCVCLWRFAYSIVGLKDEDYEGLKILFKKWPYYVVIQEDNLLDHMFADTLKKLGVGNFVFGIPCTTPLSDYWVIGDHVLEVHYPPDFRKGWEKQNRGPKTVDEFDLQHHLKMMRDEEARINVLIVKNRELADQIREMYLPYFEGGGQ